MISYIPLFLAYVALGFRFFTNFSIRFMGIPPQQVQYLSSLMKITWCFKFVFGYMVDKLNHNFKAWLIFSSLLGLLGYCLCIFEKNIIYTVSGLSLVNLSMTLSDIVIDACMVVLNQQSNISSSQIQPYGWVSLYFGIFLGYFIGGFLHDFPNLYHIWMLAPSITFVCSFFLPKYVSKAQPMSLKYSNVIINNRTTGLVCFLLFSRMAPSYAVGLDLYRNKVGIKINNISWSKAAGALSAMLSVFGHKFLFSKISLLYQAILIQILHVLLCVLDYLTLEFIEVYYMVIVDCLDQVCTALYMLLVMIYAMSICPNGYEAFYLSLIMTMYNVGNELSELLGGFEFNLLEIDSSFDNLHYSIIIKGIWVVTSCFLLCTLLK
eukprot:NODE_299_length_11430_cov_0.261054.p3 type:complete len:378 gc:universal NODE_299_length_11430_cov_0.261054:8364-9497(+)